MVIGPSLCLILKETGEPKYINIYNTNPLVMLQVAQNGQKSAVIIGTFFVVLI